MKAKIGRPILPKEKAKAEVFSVRMAANEATKIGLAIKKSGLKKPDWARMALINAAQTD
jgi:hypothetical protein